MPNLILLHISIFRFCLRRSSLSDDAEKLRKKCLRGRQRQPEQVQAGLLNAYHANHQDCWDHACHARISASSPAAAARRTGAPNGGRWWVGAHAYVTCNVRDMHGLNILDDKRSASPLAPAQIAAGGHESIFREAYSASSLSDERRKNIVNMLEIEKTRRGWQVLPGPLQ